MEDIRELRKGLCDVFSGLKEGTIKRKQGKEMINAGGKVIDSLRVELDFAKVNKSKAYIPFIAGAYDVSSK